LAPGECLGIMGRNGCGKSTLLKVICGVFRPDAGTVSVRTRLTPMLELGLGWNYELHAVDNILLTSTVMGMSLAEARASVDAILKFAELEQFARLPLKHFSSGMQARLAHAVGFTVARGVLVLDEIFAVGDLAFRARSEGRFRELLDSGRGCILVSHDPEAIERFCTRAVLLEGGRLVLDGSPAQIVTGYRRLLGGEDVSAVAAGG